MPRKKETPIEEASKNVAPKELRDGRVKSASKAAVKAGKRNGKRNTENVRKGGLKELGLSSK